MKLEGEFDGWEEFSVAIKRPDDWALSRPHLSPMNADVSAVAYADALEQKGNQWYETTFRFSAINLTDDLSQATKDKSLLESLGTVRIDLWFGQCGGPIAGLPQVSEGLDMKPIDEKSKKGMIGQTVSAGETTAIPVPGIVQFSRRNYLRPDCRVLFQDQGAAVKRNRRDSSETVGRCRQDQPRRSKRIKEHEAQVTMLRNNPCKVEHVIEELARSSKDKPIDLTDD
ncbi:hypothetical protein JCM24511_00274 [Saitozyma sp. JCM 24511]|nr:hypothetical protein JCM24511_00274 [Saitozyma sp. JCM 24511]